MTKHGRFVDPWTYLYYIITTTLPLLLPLSYSLLLHWDIAFLSCQELSLHDKQVYNSLQSVFIIINQCIKNSQQKGVSTPCTQYVINFFLRYFTPQLRMFTSSYFVIQKTLCRGGPKILLIYRLTMKTCQVKAVLHSKLNSNWINEAIIRHYAP